MRSEPINQLKIEPKTGAAFVLEKGQILRVTDTDGGQVADLFCAARDDPEQVLSSGHTTDYNGKIFLSTGDVLYSNRSSPMLTIGEDLVGSHIMLYAPCSQEMFEKSYGVQEPHPNCFDNLASALSPYGISPSQITVPLNIFMHIGITPDGQIEIKPPRSRAGDYVELRAEKDLIVGVTACAAGLCNNFEWTPVDIEIFPREG